MAARKFFGNVSADNEYEKRIERHSSQVQRTTFTKLS